MHDNAFLVLRVESYDDPAAKVIDAGGEHEYASTTSGPSHASQ